MMNLKCPILNTDFEHSIDLQSLDKITMISNIAINIIQSLYN